MDKLYTHSRGKAWSNLQVSNDLKKLLQDRLPEDMEVNVLDDGEVWVELPDGYIRVISRKADVYETFGFNGKDEPVLRERQIAKGLASTIEFVFKWATATDLSHKLEKQRSSEEGAQDADCEPTGEAEEVDEETVYDFYKE